MLSGTIRNTTSVVAFADGFAQAGWSRRARRHIRLAIAVLQLTLLTGTAVQAAQGVNLRWSSCLGDGGTYNRNFACDTNGGENVLVGSFELGAPLAQVTGNGMIIDLWFGSLGLPAWWAFTKAGFCRQTSLTLDTSLPPAAVNCVDWAGGRSSGGIGDYRVNINGFGTAKIVMSSALPASEVADLVAGQEYFSFNLKIDNAKTVGSGSCGGCAIPVCSYSFIDVRTTVAANDLHLTTTTNGTDSFLAAWQGGVTAPPNVQICPGATAARRGTWGAVKSLYR